MNFEAMTSADISRWAMQRDEKLFGDWRFNEQCTHNYATSADAVLALCERWELRVDNLCGCDDSWHCSIGIFTARATTANRALLNAACAAKHAKDKDNGN